MPIYRYSCGKCEAQFEELVRSVGDEAALRCPECGGRKIQRELSPFAAHAGREAASVSLPRGGCGRCGDPQGPCGL